MKISYLIALTLAIFQICSFAQTAQESKPTNIPVVFPLDDYTPFGYLDNPYHSFVANRSGVIRSVPPLGYGFWCRRMPWPYGAGAAREVNYLSFIDLGIVQEKTLFKTADDFKENGVELVSNYHSKNLMSYNWSFRELMYDAKYFFSGEDVILCVLTIKNNSVANKQVTLHTTNIYGYPENLWWGSDGVNSVYNNEADAGISKIWAYGDVFAIGSDMKSVCYKATSLEDEWKKWIGTNDLTSNSGATTKMPGPIYTMLSYNINVPANRSTSITLSLTRGKNELAAVKQQLDAIKNVAKLMNEKIKEDSAFYENVPLLTGDWSAEWKRGWIYDWETLRMNIRPPLGIFKHHWDGMQIFSPRSVLGEASLDAMCMSYADIELAKDMMLGTFADAVYPNIPCTREDGSMNMIGADGRECGTAPIWGAPFHVIHSIFERDQDIEWLVELYPHLKEFLDWWLINRTDEEGFFHAANSWESGQDGSRRFLIPGHDPGAAADFVRTVDIEAAMAHAMKMMAGFAEVIGKDEDVEYWQSKAAKRIESTRSMFVDGWFRDFDARTGKPIILEDYYDIMMFLPASLNIASQQQMKELEPMFYHFRDNPVHFMEWPSFLFPFTEAAWNSGLRMFNAGEVAKIGNRIYPRLDERNLQPILIDWCKDWMPEPYNYRIPGVSDEFWPIREDNPGGCENYGWGATYPTLVIRNIIGFRELLGQDGFSLAPSLPDNLVESGKSIGISNIGYRDAKVDVQYQVNSTISLATQLKLTLKKPASVKVTDAKGKVIKNSLEKNTTHNLSLKLKNGELYTVILAE